MEHIHHYQPKDLARALSVEAKCHIDEFGTDLKQLSGLLDGSIESMCSCFTEILYQASLSEAAGAPAEVAVHLEEISSICNKVITELQVHDLATQILSRMSSRMAGIEALVEKLLAAAPPTDERVRQLRVMESVCNESEMLRDSLRRKVLQKNLEVGEIELF